MKNILSYLCFIKIADYDIIFTSQSAAAYCTFYVCLIYFWKWKYTPKN